MLEKLLTHVHYGETLCGWQLGSKGEVVEVLEKQKEEKCRERTLVSVETGPRRGEPYH